MFLFLRIVLLILVCVVAAYLTICVWPTPEYVASDNFPRDYVSARKLFLSRATSQGADLSSYAIKARGPNNEQLTIDIAWFGTKNPDEVLLHISGTHGVEAFAGSAIQSEILKSPVTPPENKAIIFIHGLNPYGMAHLRRVNESNADLNRNFVLNPSGFSGAPESYRKIESFLNPNSAPTKITAFIPLTLYNIYQHGFTTLKQAIAGGQYEYPKGIYYGGSKMEESLVFLKEWMETHLSSVKKLHVIEVHTGLSEYGKDVLFWPLSKDHPRTKAYEAALGESLDSDAPDEGAGFKTPGDLQNAAPEVLPAVEVNWVLEEFGTYGPVRMLWALRDENSYHHYGKADVSHWSKTNLQNAFCPPDKEWEQLILTRGVELYGKFSALLNTSQ